MALGVITSAFVLSSVLTGLYSAIDMNLKAAALCGCFFRICVCVYALALLVARVREQAVSADTSAGADTRRHALA